MSPKPESAYVPCHECNRGGRGNDPDKCSSGWKVTKPGPYGCYLGEPIVGTPVEPPKPTGTKRQIRAKALYQQYRKYGDGFQNFLSYCYWDRDPERSWNGGRA